MSEQITPNPSVPTQIVADGLKFPKFINNLGIIPTSYKDSMSYYETVAWLCKYLEETVIPTVNQNGEAVQELQNLYIQLNEYVDHYFDTLNVQEEINNKLDEMVESGSLQLIVDNYFNYVTDLIDQNVDEINQTISNLNQSVNSQILDVNYRIDSVSSGAPSGVYTTVSALTTADPDHSKIYVVTQNGNWYYWNSTSEEWTSGGVYQASEDSFKLNNLDNYVRNAIITGTNKFDMYTVEEGYFYDYRNGGTHRANANWCNNTVNLIPGDTYTITGYTYVSYYESDGTWIDGFINDPAQNDNTHTVPANAYITRISCSITNKTSTMVELGSSASAYEPYYYKFSHSKYIETDDSDYEIKSIIEVTGTTKLYDVLTEVRGKKNIKIIVKKNIDIISELGSSFITNYSSSDIEGYLLGSGIVIEFAPNTTVTCNYDGNNTEFITRFSPFSADKGNIEGGFTLINAHIIASRVRYCVHDELFNRDGRCIHNYINCYFELDNRNANKQDVYCIGCGSGLNATYNFEKCIFDSTADTLYADRQYGILWHTSVAGDGYCYLNIIGNYFKDGIYLATGGSGTVTTQALISNNRFTKDIVKGYNSGFSNDTIEMLDYNNVIE